MKKLAVLLIPIALLTVYTGFYTLVINVSFINVFDSGDSEEKSGEEISSLEKKSHEEAVKIRAYSDEETSLLGFIEKKMMDREGGVYTNIKPGEREQGTLSESAGLLMNYCIIRNNRVLFDKEVRLLKTRLLTADYFVRWKASKEKVSCNAAIDDFRIVRALLDAYDRWGDKAYLNLAGFIQDSIYKSQVHNENLYEFYDWDIKKSNKTIPLCYLDLYTMDRLLEFNKEWKSVIDKGQNILKNGKINDKSMIFYKYYDYEKRKYLPDEEYKKEKGVCLTYTLYTALHLAEMNEDTGSFCNWLTGEMEKGKLYAWYDPKTLKPANGMESTAVYALAAVYSKKVGEVELYHKLINRMMRFMVNKADSPNCGGFGDEKTGDFYSFDNLTALWALAVE